MAWQLRVHSVPVEDLSLIPSSHGGWFTTPLTTAGVGVGNDPAPVLHRHLHSHAHIQTQSHTYTQLKLNINISNKIGYLVRVELKQYLQENI